MTKHQWINKRTPKGDEPVKEWLECKACGAIRHGEHVAPVGECVK